MQVPDASADKSGVREKSQKATARAAQQIRLLFLHDRHTAHSSDGQRPVGNE